jgi:hypothetical protein
MTAKTFLSTGSIVALTALFFGSAVTKALYVIGKAPQDVKVLTDTMFPHYIRTPLLAPIFASVSSLVLFIAVFEFAISLAFFYRPRLAAFGVICVMLGAEYVGFAVNGSSAHHPLCGKAAVCPATQGLHFAIAGLAGLIFVLKTLPLCSQVNAAYQLFFGKATRGTRNTNNPYASKNRKSKNQ